MKNFSITCRQSSGNLHIDILGEFNGQCAWELIRIINECYEKPGRIFVQTKHISHIEKKGLSLYKQLYNDRRIPLQNFYFKGEKGFKIALNGQRILLCPKDRHSSKKIPRKKSLPILTVHAYKQQQ